MSKLRSQAHLDQLKSIKISELVLLQVKFERIVMQVMKQSSVQSPHGLMKGSMKSIDQAKKFWEEILPRAEVIVQEGKN